MNVINYFYRNRTLVITKQILSKDNHPITVDYNKVNYRVINK